MFWMARFIVFFAVSMGNPYIDPDVSSTKISSRGVASYRVRVRWLEMKVKNPPLPAVPLHCPL